MRFRAGPRESYEGNDLGPSEKLEEARRTSSSDLTERGDDRPAPREPWSQRGLEKGSEQRPRAAGLRNGYTLRVWGTPLMKDRRLAEEKWQKRIACREKWEGYFCGVSLGKIRRVWIKEPDPRQIYAFDWLRVEEQVGDRLVARRKCRNRREVSLAVELLKMSKE